MNNSEWLESEDGYKYKKIAENGHWLAIRWYGDAAIYSYCTHCGYQHACYKDLRNEDGSWAFNTVYAPEKEFKYCPMCGEDMETEMNWADERDKVNKDEDHEDL